MWIKTIMYQTLREYLPKISKVNLAHRADIICQSKTLHVCQLVNIIGTSKTIVLSENRVNKLFVCVFVCVCVLGLSWSNAL